MVALGGWAFSYEQGTPVQVREKVYVLGGQGSQTGPVGAYGDPHAKSRQALVLPGTLNPVSSTLKRAI